MWHRRGDVQTDDGGKDKNDNFEVELHDGKPYSRLGEWIGTSVWRASVGAGDSSWSAIRENVFDIYTLPVS